MNINDLIKLIPSSKANLSRLDFLLNNASLPRIAVFGAYNHGKSSLLNALVGEEIFKAADKRETIEIQEHEYADVIWVDTPGLNADIAEIDDKIAKESAFKVADYIFIVHNAQTGELDRHEKSLYNQLMRQDKSYKKKLFLILTQIDQLDKENLEVVQEQVIKQMPNLKVFPVSSTRYLKGKKKNSQKLMSESGIEEVIKFIKELKADSKELRAKEIKRLVAKAKAELDTLSSDNKRQLDSSIHEYKEFLRTFESELKKIVQSIRNKLRPFQVTGSSFSTY